MNPKDEVLPREVLLEKMNNADAVFSLLTDKMDADFLSKLHRPKIIANCAVGFDNIDIPAATKQGIVVTNTPGVLTDTTADFAFTLLVATARRIVESDKYTRAGRFRKWGLLLMLGPDIHGKTLGLLGMGRIGKAVAKRAAGFDMKIIYNDVFRDEAYEKESGATYMTKEEVIRNADFLSLHVPLLKETHHLISDREFAMMKPSAILINTSRGPVVDEAALARSLKSKKIFAAGLDVYEFEPKVNEELLKLDNVILAPHIASASIETRTKMAELASDNIIMFLTQGIAKTPVNPDVLKK
jgi:glyoxylate reductase